MKAPPAPSPTAPRTPRVKESFGDTTRPLSGWVGSGEPSPSSHRARMNVLPGSRWSFQNTTRPPDPVEATTAGWDVAAPASSRELPALLHPLAGVAFDCRRTPRIVDPFHHVTMMPPEPSDR